MDRTNRLRYLRILTFLLLVVIACANNQSENTVNPEQQSFFDSTAFQDTIWKWKAYAELSDDGIWEDDGNHRVNFEWVATYGGEKDIMPPFYTAATRARALIPFIISPPFLSLIILDNSVSFSICRINHHRFP